MYYNIYYTAVHQTITDEIKLDSALSIQAMQFSKM